MMYPNYLTREQTRAADRFAIERLGLPGIVLMENAGRGCAEILIRELDSQPTQIVIVCGPGNNGGDGFVIARHLLNHGINSRVVLTKPISAYTGDALVNLKVLQHLPIPLVTINDPIDERRAAQMFEELTASDWIVDAMLGTGATGLLRSPFLQLVESANRSPAKKLAVDIPTGLDCDNGLPQPTAIQAELTCTFIAPKIGFLQKAAADYLGRIEVVGIGVPFEQTFRPAR